MKATTLIFTGISFLGLFILGACNNGNRQSESNNHNQEQQVGKDNEGGMHQQHQSLKNKFAHQDIVILEIPYMPGQAVNKELVEVVNAYMAMKNAFVNDDAASADKVAEVMAEKVKAVDGQPLESEGKKGLKLNTLPYMPKN